MSLRFLDLMVVDRSAESHAAEAVIAEIGGMRSREPTRGRGDIEMMLGGIQEMPGMIEGIAEERILVIGGMIGIVVQEADPGRGIADIAAVAEIREGQGIRGGASVEDVKGRVVSVAIVREAEFELGSFNMALG